MSEWRDPAGGDDAFAQYVAQRISGIPGVLAARGEWITNDELLVDKAGLRPADMAVAGLSADPQVLARAIVTAERLIAEAVEPFGL